MNMQKKTKIKNLKLLDENLPLQLPEVLLIKHKK